MNPPIKYSQSPVLLRYEGNPLLQPIQHHSWESKATFNPAALLVGRRVHIVYRAIGDSDISTLGYAASRNGLDIDERLDQPIYTPREPFEGTSYSHSDEIEPAEGYTSGGGPFGGCEDPRLTRIGDRIYMTYVAYDGYSPPRVAHSSISVSDFLNKRWRWKKPVLISEPGIINKNACIFPEKIKGKFVIFHRVFPDILVDYVDDLDFDGQTRWLQAKDAIRPRALFWDSLKVGAGAPPIKTDMGWLFIYQAVDDLDPMYHYKIGAMLLDLEDPAKVLARGAIPILEPRASYEFDGWKSGVLYPCGAVVVGGRLRVYYGASDKVTCVATAELKPFMEKLRAIEHKNTK
jgi:predicted GH43/DUF377 family glycosyl hydrolase